MKILTGDTVLVLSGKDKGKTGKVVRALPKLDAVLVEGVNLITKHIKAGAGRPGERVTFEKPLPVCKVKLVVDGKPTRVGYKMLENGKKQRIAKKTGEAIVSTFKKVA